MASVTEAQVTLLTEGLKLVYDLFKGIDRTMVLQALSRKIPIPPVTRIYNWEETQHLIQANPEFLNSQERQDWWATRTDPQSQVCLMVELGRELRSGQRAEIYLFAPEVRDNTGLLQLVMSVTSEVKLVLESQGLSGPEKTLQIIRILEEAAA